MNTLTTLPPPLSSISDPWLKKHDIQMDILRCDRVHPTLSGNKLFKLKYNVMQAKQARCPYLVSFGGAYSNHLHALAAAGHTEQMKTIGIVRGQLPNPLNPTLLDAQGWGMQLIGVDREEYRQQRASLSLQRLGIDGELCWVIPEGGANQWGVQGATEILSSLNREQIASYDWVVLPVGTGTTLAGVVANLASMQLYATKVLGMVVLKGAISGLQRDVQLALDRAACSSSYQHHWYLDDSAHCGGYARLKPGLLSFMDKFSTCTNIPIEPVYTGKMLYALYRMIEDQRFSRSSRILVVHTGGLQGLRGMSQYMAAMREKYAKDLKQFTSWYS